jgi:hypothetical protein
MPQQRDSDPSRRAHLKRRAARAVVDATMEEQRLTALVYPTLRRQPARIGELQLGSNCQLSATTGLPALSVPVGFTDDGVPVGVDLLGAAFSEPELLSIGYGIEQATRPRRAPFSTPPLEHGQRPVPKKWTTSLPCGNGRTTAIAWTYDSTTGRLTYAFDHTLRENGDVVAIWIHRSTEGKPGGALKQIAGGVAAPQGTVVLSSSERADFGGGRLQLRVYTRQSGFSLAPVPLVPDQRAGL